MPPPTSPGLIDRAAIVVLAALLLLIPLLHATDIADPFGLPKQIALLAGALILAGLAIAGTIRGGAGPRPRPAALVPAAALTACSLVALIPAANRGLAAGSIADLLAGLVLFGAVIRFARDPGGIAILLRAGLAGASLVALGTILQVLVPGAALSLGGWSLLPPSRSGAAFGEAGLAAQYLILSLPAGIGAAALSRGILRQVCGAGLGLVAAALIFAGRPEGWLAALLVLALLTAGRVLQVALSGKDWRRLAPSFDGASLRAFLIALIAVLLVTGLSRWPALRPSGHPVAPLDGVTLMAPTTGVPSADRAAAARATLWLLRLHPLGVGPGNWRHAVLEVAWSRVSPSPFTLNHQVAHAGNNLLERAAETGWLGGPALVVLLAVLVLQSSVAMARAPAPWDAVGFAAFGTCAAAIVLAFLGSPFEDRACALLFWVGAGLAEAALRQAPGLPARLRFLRPAGPGREAGRRVWGYAVLWAAATLLIAPAARARLQASRLSLAGQAAFHSGRYEDAVRIFAQPASRRSPDHLARMLSGSALLRLGRPLEAAREFGDALNRSPRFPAAFLGRASAWQEAGRYDLAQKDLETLLVIWPGNVDTRLALARLLAIRGMPDAALDEYRSIARADPNAAEPYFRMGEIFLRRGQVDEAIEAFRLCGSQNPRYPRLQMSMGNAFTRKGLLDMALSAYQAAASIDERDVEARLMIANTQHALGEYCQARDALEAARDLETDSSQRDRILDLIRKVEPDCARQGRAKPRAPVF